MYVAGNSITCNVITGNTGQVDCNLSLRFLLWMLHTDNRTKSAYLGQNNIDVELDKQVSSESLQLLH